MHGSNQIDTINKSDIFDNLKKFYLHKKDHEKKKLQVIQ